MNIELGLFDSARRLLIFKLHLRNSWSFGVEVKTYGIEIEINPIVFFSWSKYHQSGPSIVNLHAKRKRDRARTAEFFALINRG